MITEKLEKIQNEKNDLSDLLRKTQSALDLEREQLKETVQSRLNLEKDKKELLEKSSNTIKELELNLNQK